jgi:large subunit ribosomal protein L24
MKKTQFSRTWKASSQPRKQRKYIATSPLHIKAHQLSVHLSKELRSKHGRRQIRARAGDKVKILRGQHKGKEGKIEDVNTRSMRVFISKIEQTRKDGSRTRTPLHPSNLMIIELVLDDKKRAQRLEKKA